MNESIFQKLKRVQFKDILSLFLFLMAIPLSIIYYLGHKHLWLFCDSPNEARDNAYCFFQYVRINHTDQEAIFALNKNSPDIDKVISCGSIVAFGSLKHWVLYLAAENVISSQKASGPNAAICYILERLNLVHCNKIFLQHGIIKDDIPFLYYKYTHIRLFTCSTLREWEYVNNHYGYPSGCVQLLGLCRFDNLFCLGSARRQIVVMPTWRKWLSHPTGNLSPSDLEPIFLESSYYRHWNALLNQELFLSGLEQYNVDLVFYLHREAQRYCRFFQATSSRVTIAAFPEYDVQSLLIESALLITDYSSVAMDFAYMNKPVLYYQFDYSSFRLNHLKEGYFNYKKEGFGKVCCTEQELVEAVFILLQNNMLDDELYERRRKDFFTLRDDKNCMRTYEAIKALDS